MVSMVFKLNYIYVRYFINSYLLSGTNDLKINKIYPLPLKNW